MTVGGLLIYGILGFKREKEIVTCRTELLEGGIEFVLNCEIGKDITFDAMREKHDARLIATGVYKARELQLAGAGLGGVVPALDFLTASNRKSLGDDVPAFDDGILNADGKNVVVIGGGDTAMDCVRTAIRQNAKSVTCLYRRDKANMPGSQREVENAEEEGVQFKWLSAPVAVLGDSTHGQCAPSVSTLASQMKLAVRFLRQLPIQILILMLIWSLRRLALILKICHPCLSKRHLGSANGARFRLTGRR